MFFEFQVVSFALLLMTSASSRVIEKDHRSNEYDWDHLIFTQQWPQSTCELEYATKRHTCKVPRTVKSWTVHGIWPTLGITEGPQNCNASWGFDPLKIESILSELKVHWPNLYTDTEFTSFWDHEWITHGTCAASLDSLRGELNYFQAGLLLNKKYKLLEVLSKHDILPSYSRAYGIEEVLGALHEEFGHTVCLDCFEINDIEQLLYQVYICLDKNLSMINCPVCKRYCDDGKNLVYHPIENYSTY